jgi:hypothetical protein
MAAQALVEQACKYRVIRQVLSGLTKQSKKGVYQDLSKEYPVGLSEKYAKALIRYADQAVLAMGKGPRMKGMIAGCAGAVVLYAAYYFGGIRQGLLPEMIQSGHKSHMILPDLVIWALGYSVTILAIKMLAAGALKKLLPEEIQTEERGLPSAGEQGWMALGITFVAWFVLAFLAAPPPDWIEAITRVFGHH